MRGAGCGIIMARNYRYKNWDYKGCGIYMITVNVEDASHCLAHFG